MTCGYAGKGWPGHGRSVELASGDDWEIDFGCSDHVDEVRPGIERDVKHDLDHLCIVVANSLHGMEVVFADVAAFLDELDREAHRRIRLGIVRGTFAVHRNLRLIELREVLAEVRMGRQAVAAPVLFGHRQRNTLARRGWQTSLAERGGQAEVAFERSGTVRDEAEHVRHDAELLLDA